MDERRRYFRIEDNIGVRYELLRDEEVADRQAALFRGEFEGNNQLHSAERQLQLLIDKLRVQNPEFAEAIHLLNTKFNALKDDLPSQRELRPTVTRASISACGVSFDVDEQFRPGDKMYFDITLLPTDLHVHTIAQVVHCKPTENPHEWNLSVDFLGLSEVNEELMVQHIVKRQGRLLAEQRKNT